MSKRNKNNSLIFLTTLSVYLGLVLVGAPAVLSQAALTRNFDVRDEIEFKDDLDKKPDDCEELKRLAEEKLQSVGFDNQSFSEYAAIVKNLIEASREANSKGFSYSEKANFGSRDGLRPKFISITKLAASEIAPKQIFHKINGELKALFGLYPVQTDVADVNLSTSFQLSDKEFTITTKFLQSDNDTAQKFLSAFNANLEHLKCGAVVQTANSIVENTNALVENNHFVIITRLPRGSLDALFVKSAK